MKRSFAVCCVLFFALFIADQSEGHTLTVDVDAATPGIQATAAYLPGTLFMVDIILTSSGVAFPVIDSFQMDVQFNDTPGVITYGGLTLSGGGIGGLVGAGATDVVAGGPAPPGTPLAPLSPAGALAFGAGIAGGSGMAFTANDGGTGIYDIGGLPFVPGPAGTASCYFIPSLYRNRAYRVFNGHWPLWAGVPWSACCWNTVASLQWRFWCRPCSWIA